MTALQATASRRPVLRLLVGLLAALLVAPALAQSAPERFSSVAVDVGPLRAKGLGEYAEIVGGALQKALATAFADRIAPGGPRLVVRIDAISLRDYAGGEGRFFGGGTPNDYLDGEALVVGRRGEILMRHPQLSAVPASSGGAWYNPDQESNRVVALAEHYAGWLKRGL